MYKTLSVASLMAATAVALPAMTNVKRDDATAHCFPYGDATLPSDYSAPNVSRSDWWCPSETQTGFQGFSYPLEVDDCSDPSNGFDQMNADFAKMKADFGATMVRLYYPACTQSSVFENALKAGVANNMAVIPQIWFGFDGDDSVWKASQQALYDVLDSDKYGAIAPYVFHSADFGSEPIGDGVDDGNDQFISDLGAFRSKLNGKGIPAGISEDWDRPGTMANNDASGLADVGQRVLDNSDYIHAHVMPFYHGNLNEDETWGYIEPQLKFLNQTLGQKNFFITETQWAWGDTDHYPNHNDLSVDSYTAYWKQFDDKCEALKGYGVGWFWHAWQGEDTFDEAKRGDDGSISDYVIPAFKPRKC